MFNRDAKILAAELEEFLSGASYDVYRAAHDADKSEGAAAELAAAVRSAVEDAIKNGNAPDSVTVQTLIAEAVSAAKI